MKTISFKTQMYMYKNMISDRSCIITLYHCIRANTLKFDLAIPTKRDDWLFVLELIRDIQSLDKNHQNSKNGVADRLEGVAWFEKCIEIRDKDKFGQSTSSIACKFFRLWSPSVSWISVSASLWSFCMSVTCRDNLSPCDILRVSREINHFVYPTECFRDQ